MDRAKILESWKEIASYLNRNVRTCQMWEMEHGLPIHRLDGSPKAHVFAYKDELDAWLDEKLHGKENGGAARNGRRPREKVPFFLRWNMGRIAVFSVIGAAAAALLITVGPIRNRDGSRDIPGAGHPAPGSWKNSVAVLPFEDLSADHTLEYKCESLTDNISTKLGSIKGLRVISRRSARRFTGKEFNPGDIRRELKVATVLEATLQAHDDLVRVNANLVRTRDGLYVLSRSYSRASEDMLGLEDEIARDVALALDIELTPESQARTKRKDPQDDRDYDVFLLGRHYENRYMDRDEEEDFGKAVERLTTYVSAHPDYALAYCSLGNVHEHRFALHDRPEDEESMRRFYEKAYALNPGLEETHMGMGWADFYRRDFDRSYAHFQSAVALGPDNPEVLWNVGSFLLSIGLSEKGFPYYERALVYDPLNPGLHCLRATAYLHVGEYEKGLSSIERAISLDSENTGYLILSVRLLFLLRRTEEASGLLERLPGDADKQPAVRLLWALISAVREDREKALSLLRELERLAPGRRSICFPEAAGVFSLLGMKDEAVQTIEEGIRTGFAVAKTELYSYPYLRSCPFFEALRETPQFQAVVRRQLEIYRARMEKYRGL